MPHQIYGLRRYYYKEDAPAPDNGFQQLLKKGMPSPFLDLRIASAATKNVVYGSNETYFSEIMSESKFHAFVANLSKQSTVGANHLNQ